MKLFKKSYCFWWAYQFKFVNNLKEETTQMYGELHGNIHYVDQSFQFDGESYIDSKIQIYAMELRTVCFNILIEERNQTKTLISLADSMSGVEIVLYNTELR